MALDLALRALLQRGAGRGRGDLDPARPQRLGHLPLQLDGQQAIDKIGASHLDVVGKLEATREGAARYAAIQELAFLLGALALAGHHQQVRLHGDIQFLTIEAGDRHGDAVTVIAELHRVVRRPTVDRLRAGGVLQQIEDTVETDARPMQRGKIKKAVTHGHILFQATWDVPPARWPGVPAIRAGESQVGSPETVSSAALMSRLSGQMPGNVIGDDRTGSRDATQDRSSGSGIYGLDSTVRENGIEPLLAEHAAGRLTLPAGALRHVAQESSDRLTDVASASGPGRAPSPYCDLTPSFIDLHQHHREQQYQHGFTTISPDEGP